MLSDVEFTHLELWIISQSSTFQHIFCQYFRESWFMEHGIWKWLCVTEHLAHLVYSHHCMGN